jgi:hypothetical protein
MAVLLNAPIAFAQDEAPGPAESPEVQPPQEPPGDPGAVPGQQRLGNLQVFTLQRPSMSKLLGIESIPENLDTITISPQLRDLVRRLDDESFQERVRVTEELVALRCADDEFYAVLDREPISAEQRWRILAALRERLATRPSGAMGIRFSRLINEAVIEQVIPGMPAERVLQAGDRITHINGQLLAGREDLVAHVQRRPPGSIIKLTIQRPQRDPRGLPIIDPGLGQQFDVVNVDLELGSLEELDRISRELGEGPVQQSAVQRERINLAQTAAQRFSPKPTPVQIEGGLPEQLRIGADDVAGPGDVEDYPPLQTLLTQRKYIEQGMLTITPTLQKQWEAHIQLMQDRIMSGTLSRTEREYLIRAFVRYRDVVGDLLRQ